MPGRSKLIFAAGLCAAILAMGMTLRAQPTGLSDLRPSQRLFHTKQILEELRNIDEMIRKEPRKMELLLQRLSKFRDLIDLNFDNDSRDSYAAGYENTLSEMIAIEDRIEHYEWRGNARSDRLGRMKSPKKFSGLYPRNDLFDGAASDYETVIRRSQSPDILVRNYAYLGWLYRMRAFHLSASPYIKKPLKARQMQMALKDIGASNSYFEKAIEIARKWHDPENIRAEAAINFRENGKAAVRLGAYEEALKSFERGKGYLNHWSQPCEFYAPWGRAYLRQGNFGEAFRVFNTILPTENESCAEIFADRGDAHAAAGSFAEALSDYQHALKLASRDGYNRKGRILLGLANLNLKFGKPEETIKALDEALKLEKKYAANCPQVYALRSEIYRKMGKHDLAGADKKKAKELKFAEGCSILEP